MKNPFVLYFIVVFLILTTLPSFAQGNLKELGERIGKERNFARIQRIASNYFAEEKREKARRERRDEKESDSRREEEEEEDFESPEVFYHRWALYNASRLDAKGNITDTKNKNLAAIDAERNITSKTDALISNSNWTLQGPNTYTSQRLMLDGLARVDCIAFHPTNASIMYAGTPMGGLFKTTDGGFSWSQINGLYPFLGIGGVVVNHSNGNEIWALAGSAENPNTWGIFATQGGCRVYRSTDGGINWAPTTAFPGIGNAEGFDLIQHPNNANTLYAATSTGVYRTTDGGVNWTLTTLTNGVWDLDIHPISNRLYAVGVGFVRYSTDGGNTWPAASFDVSVIDMNRGSLAISPYGISNYIYLLAGPAKKGKFQGLYRSNNGGLNFTRMSSTPNVFDTNTDGSGDFNQSGYDNCIVAHPTDYDRILTGGAAIWQSSDGGVTMKFNSYYWNSATEPSRYVHPDVHGLKRNPLNNFIYALTDGGIYVSENFGTSWSRRTNGISGAQIFHFTTYKNNFFMEAFGSQDNGVKIRRNNGSYEQFGGADGYGVQFSLNDSSVLYATQNAGFAKFGSFGATDLSVTYPFVSADPHWYILPKVTPSATNTEILFAASLDTLSRSTNGGASWSRQLRRANWDIAYAPSNPAYIYTAGGANYSAPNGFTLSRSNNYGISGSWTDISGTLGSFGQRAMKIAVDPSDDQRIYVCLGGYTAGQKVYRSLNGGTTWSLNISYNLPNVPVNALATDKAGNVYAGTDIGVYVLPSGKTQWVAFYNSLPRVPITDLIVNDAQQFIKASTFGTGIWKSNLYGACPPTTLVSFEQRGRQTFEASDFVNAFQFTMSGGYAFTDIRIRAGNRIIFTPGSDLKNGTLLATIGPCGEPFPAPILRVDKGEAKKEEPGNAIPDRAPVNQPVNAPAEKKQQKEE